MRVLGLLIATMLQAEVAQAQVDDSHNAASWYEQAWQQYHAIAHTISDDQWIALWNFEGEAWRGPSETVRANILRFQPVIDLVNHGLAQPECNYPSDDTSGPWPGEHLGHIRNVV